MLTPELCALSEIQISPPLPYPEKSVGVGIVHAAPKRKLFGSKLLSHFRRVR